MPVVQLSYGNCQELHTKSVCHGCLYHHHISGSQGEDGREGCTMALICYTAFSCSGSTQNWQLYRFKWSESWLVMSTSLWPQRSQRSCQAPLSMKFSREKYWNVLPFPSLGTFLNQGLNLGLLHCRQILYHLSHQGTWEQNWPTCVNMVYVLQNPESRTSTHFFLIFKIMQIWWHIYRRHIYRRKYRTRLYSSTTYSN